LIPSHAALICIRHIQSERWRIVLLPGFLALAMFASLGPALLITALNVKYRDFRHIVPFIVQVGLYASPVGFSGLPGSLCSLGVVAFLLWFGIAYFRRTERAFADLI
jgi:homopolymeric O-antigen transport system permease protein